MKARLVIGNYNYSSWSLRAWLAACWSELEFDVLRLPLDTDAFRKEIAALSPSRCVPVLEHEGNRIWDSLAICEYLAERFPQAALWPADPRARIAARCVSAEMHSGFGHLRALMPMNCRASGRRVSMTPALAGDIDRVRDIWHSALLDSGGPFLYGSRSIADAMFAPVVFRFETYGVELDAETRRYASDLLAMDAMQLWLYRAKDEVEVIEADEAGV